MLEKIFGDGSQETQLPCKKCGTLVYRQSDLDLSSVYCHECQQRYGLHDSTKVGQNSSASDYPGQNPPATANGSTELPESEGGLRTPNHKVILTDVRIPFWRMVLIILKWALASIPAAILLWLVIALITLLFGAGIGGCAALLSR